MESHEFCYTGKGGPPPAHGRAGVFLASASDVGPRFARSFADSALASASRHLPVAESSPHRRADEEDEDRPDGAPDLSDHEQQKADEEESLSADITHEVVRREGEEELKRSTAALAWS